jgi:hypothetical protein
MAADYARCARHDWPEFLRPFVQAREPNAVRVAAIGAERQLRHRGASPQP